MRGDIYQLRAPRGARGHKQSGVRYAIVVQSDDRAAAGISDSGISGFFYAARAGG
ncbi:hypothetical protein ADILRU_1038 [Leifsonia rubra CMS 76R]|nr:hypothetical protein ADILRU_1038 [Leifsonia rubra CMS 76R]